MPTSMTTALGRALLEALRTDRDKPDLPIHTHAQRLPSGQRGLSLDMLRAVGAFYEASGGLGKVMGAVCKEKGYATSVCAITRCTGLSLAESLVIVAGRRGDDARALVGDATTFFSYSWNGTKLGDMLAAVEGKLTTLEAADGRRRYVWIDMFCASQTLLAGEFEPDKHERGTDERKARKEDTDTIFEHALNAVGELLLYCSPLTERWPAPRQPFLDPGRTPPAGCTVDEDGVPVIWERRGPGATTRAWCMFEMVSCLARRYPLHVVLSPADVAGFKTLLLDRFDEIATIVASLDARDAQISKTEDREYILGEVAKLDGGLSSVTAKVCASLREWLANEGRAELARMDAAERGTSLLLMNVARLLQAQGKLDEAEPLYREALEASRATLGDRHPDTLVSISNMASLLQDQGKVDEAAPLYREALEAERATLGDRHPSTLGSIGDMAHLLQAQGKLDEAEPLCREALEAKRATLGDRHPDTLVSINNMARLLQAQGKLDEAEALRRELS